MSHFNYLNAEQAIRVANTFRDAVAAEDAPSGRPSYNTCTLFVRQEEIDVIAERLGVSKKVFEPKNENETLLHVIEWASGGARITFQSVESNP